MPSAAGPSSIARGEDAVIERLKSKAGGASLTAAAQRAARGPESLGVGEGYHSPHSRDALQQQVGHLERLTANTNENLMRAIQTSQVTHDTGYATIRELGMQRETMQRTMERVDETRGTLQQAKQVIRDIRYSVYREWAIKGLILLALFLIIVFLIYFKFVRRWMK